MFLNLDIISKKSDFWNITLKKAQQSKPYLPMPAKRLILRWVIHLWKALSVNPSAQIPAQDIRSDAQNPAAHIKSNGPVSIQPSRATPHASTAHSIQAVAAVDTKRLEGCPPLELSLPPWKEYNYIRQYLFEFSDRKSPCTYSYLIIIHLIFTLVMYFNLIDF